MANFRRFFTRRKIIVYIIILGVGGFTASRIFAPPDTDNILTDTVKRQDVKRTVLATAQVVSETDLDLSFKSSGRVSLLSARVGDRVKAGQVLAALEQQSELASLKSAQGALVSAQANYQKVLEGVRTEEIAVAEAAVASAEVALRNTEAEQEIAVANAYRKYLNTDVSAIAITRFDTAATLTVTGTYNGSQEGEYRVKLEGTGSTNFYYHVSGLETYSGLVVRGSSLPLGTRGLTATFSTAGTLSAIDEWAVKLPNNISSSYVVNYNAYLAALETQKSANSTAEANLNQTRADLALKKAAARPSEIEAARAQTLSAEGGLATAQSALENTVIRAPAAGTITKVDIKIGELASALVAVIILQDVDNLYLEANISEANIAGLRVGQSAKATFDALGSDKIYEATVQFIEPSSTVVSGVVNYKIKAALPKAAEILPGMTADLKILVEEKLGVVVVPQRAVLSHDEKKWVRLITDENSRAYEEREVALGLFGDGGVVEILSGLAEGQRIVTFINKN